MVTDPDAAERAIDEGIEHVRRARAPAFSAAFIGSFKVGTALMRGDARGAAELGRRGAGYMGRGRSMAFAFALHLLGDHEGADAGAGPEPTGAYDIGLDALGWHLLRALTAGARARFDVAHRELAAAAAHVRRYRYPLTLNDCVIAAGALAVMEGRLERACVLLAAVADRSFVRTPEAWAVYLHYRRPIRAGLDVATIRRCREEAQTLDLDQALDEEIAWGSSPG